MDAVKKKINALLIVTLITVISLSFLTPPTHGYVMEEYALLSDPYGVDHKPLNIIIGGTGGDLNNYVYFTEQLGGRIGSIDVTTFNKVEEWATPTDPIAGYSEPWDLDNASDGTIFYTDYHLNWIGQLDPSDGSITCWGIPTPSSGPRGIFVVSDTVLWFTEYLAGKISKLDTSGTPPIFTEYTLPSGSNPQDIMVVGNNVWWTDYARDKIGVLMESGTTAIIREYSLLGGSRPYDLTIDPDGHIWFTCSDRNVIGELNPWTERIVEHRSIPTTGSKPRGIGIDNNTREVWITEYAGHRIVKYVPGENLFIEYPTLTLGSAPSGIALRPGSVEVFFTEWSANRIGKLTMGAALETSTSTATGITSAVTGTFKAATTNTTTATATVAPTITTASAAAPSSTHSFTGTYATATTLTGTAYRLSTSSKGTSTSSIIEVIYTSTTSTYTSTTYVSTVSQTLTNVSTSVSTSYIATTPVTLSTTSYATQYTGTMTMTSTSTLTVPNTLTMTLTSTKYRSTTSATTSVTSTGEVQAYQTLTKTTTRTTTVPATTPTTATTTPTTTTGILPNFTMPCIIASAAYGSELSPAVQYLRNFRDSYVKATYAGSRFMEVFNAWYYSFSPTIAGWVAGSLSARTAVKAFLYPLFGILEASAVTYHTFDFSPELGITLAGILAASLIGLIYDAPLVIFAQYHVWRKWRFVLRLGHLKPLLYVWVSSIIGIGLAEVFRLSVLMRVSTAALVLSSMAGSALLVTILLFKKIDKKGLD